ncbi:gamma-glutamylcyclotransferase [Maribius pontilimi]|uniref:ADP-ribose pyrophosphatase n=1 Tax=Palleronia pontilimi TaxID=1964209 RepID=A0A934IJC7_9RHOB|nr:gamma-glutamylcyclotransferase [Palleronia pontilimi]MBJ3764006.1 gamma-glutamylcyclotransferase [Palleronia pontilimi]
MTKLFLFGTLLDDDLRALVAGCDAPARPAILPGHNVFRAAGADFPALKPDPGGQAHGLVFEFDPDAMARLDYYEAGFGFRPARLRVELDGAATEAVVYRPMSGAEASDDPWSLADWQAKRAPLTRVAATEAMGYFGRIDGATLRARLPMIFVRAEARLRAQANPGPRTLRTDTHRDRVQVIDDRRPYTNFFRCDETDLRHPRFAGGLSETVTRAGFVMGDAVTVLPYDPRRDRVMLIEQFRFGPFARGDLYPWCLEPIAGRIDPGETPETAARREAREEADLELGDLLFIASHYPSPGAVSDYLYNYLGLCDLPDTAGGLGGNADEHEDIRAHVIPFARLMELVESGEVDQGPLVLSALWLDRERSRRRFA